MGKSQFVVVLLCSFALNINTGYALRCYGCSDGSKEDMAKLQAQFNTTTPKDNPKCKDGIGKEFECSGSCINMSFEGKSEFF